MDEEGNVSVFYHIQTLVAVLADGLESLISVRLQIHVPSSMTYQHLRSGEPSPDGDNGGPPSEDCYDAWANGRDS